MENSSEEKQIHFEIINEVMEEILDAVFEEEIDEKNYFMDMSLDSAYLEMVEGDEDFGLEEVPDDIMVEVLQNYEDFNK